MMHRKRGIPDARTDSLPSGAASWFSALMSDPALSNEELLCRVAELEALPGSADEARELEVFEQRWPLLRASIEQRVLAASTDAVSLRPPVAKATTKGGQSIASLRPRPFRAVVNRALDEFLTADLGSTVIRPLENMGWNGVSVYVPDPSSTTLQVVAASDSTAVYTLSHSLFVYADVWPDIEVDIFTRGRAERLLGGGWDPRFNCYLYETYDHKRFRDRLFVPLVLVRKREDCSLCQSACRWVRSGNVWTPQISDEYQIQVIGSLSVSRYDVGPDDLIEETLRFATELVAQAVHRASLSGLCERVLEELMRRLSAKHGAIHVGRDSDCIFSGEHAVVLQHGTGVTVGAHDPGGVAARPRPGGIGAEALASGDCVRVAGAELSLWNPRLTQMGVRATTAAPLLNASEECIGVVYLHYDSPDANPAMSDLMEAAGHAIGVALRWEDRSLTREQLLGEAKSFAQSPRESLAQRLKRMAHFVWTLLGCDHVSIVALDTAQGRIEDYAGRHLMDAEEAGSRPDGWAAKEVWRRGLRQMDVPSAAMYFEQNAARWQPQRAAFMQHEGIEASALVPLLDGDTPVGFLAVDYRAPHDFEHKFRSEKKLLETLAALFGAGVLIYREHGTQAEATLIERANAAIVHLAIAQPEIEYQIRAQLTAGSAARVGIIQ